MTAFALRIASTYSTVVSLTTRISPVWMAAAAAGLSTSRTRPLTEPLPMPTPLESTAETVPTLMKSVEPLTPDRVPAVCTTRSPSLRRPSSLALPMARLKVLVEELCSGTRRGFTPQQSCSWRATCTSLVMAKIGVLGRNLLTLRAVEPPFVSGKIAAALSWRAMLLTAWQIALPIVGAMLLSWWRWG